MIEFNRILQPRLVQPLVRLFGMKIGGSPAPTLAPEIAPGFDVNQMDDPTLAFIRGERLQAYGINIAAVVGQSGVWRYRNPANSGVLMVPEWINYSGASTLIIGPSVGTTDLANVATSIPRDSRWVASGGSRGAIVPSWETNAAPATAQAAILFATQPYVQQLPEMVIPPGAFLNLHMVTANTAGQLVLAWRERPVAAEELATG